MKDFQIVLSMSVAALTPSDALQIVQATVVQKGLQDFIYLVTENGDSEESYFVDGVGNRLSFDEVEAQLADRRAEIEADAEDFTPPPGKLDFAAVQPRIVDTPDIATIDEEAEARAVAESLA